LKIYDKATLNQVYADYLDEDDWGFTEDEPCENAHFTSYNGVVYADCTTLSGDYTGGNASCNSSCSGYNTGSCEEEDGW